MPTYRRTGAPSAALRRGLPVLLREAAHQALGLRREAGQGAVAGGHRPQGLEYKTDNRSSSKKRTAPPAPTTATPRRRHRDHGHQAATRSRRRRSRRALPRRDRRALRRPTPSPRSPMADADLGVFGGSGFYSFLQTSRPSRSRRPTTFPSADLAVGTVGGRRVAFLPRHGSAHTISPARIPQQRAELWAMRSLGVRTVVGPCAGGFTAPRHRAGIVRRARPARRSPRP